ncbi:PTS glucitol/sorbitol transporter subunit IIA [Streptococcus ferus]|uniref:PTS glucitol/sorbitol transporter subunit IIA n=1 Tax=Streptococcus ferus TaxID=1345 RepID=UPI0035A1C66A
MEKIFDTTVIAIGPEAPAMISDANMLILFGAEVPEDLAEYCYKIDNKDLSGQIAKGGQLKVGEHIYPITAVGAVVDQNLKALGHITISLDGSSEESLPGTLHVQGDNNLTISEGTRIQILI